MQYNQTEVISERVADKTFYIRSDSTLMKIGEGGSKGLLVESWCH